MKLDHLNSKRKRADLAPTGQAVSDDEDDEKDAEPVTGIQE